MPDLDRDGKERFDDDGNLKMMTDGYRSTNPGAKGVRTMKLDEEFSDELVSVRRIPDLKDNLFVLTKKGMMIRLAVDQTKETSGKSPILLRRSLAFSGMPECLSFLCFCSHLVAAKIVFLQAEESCLLWKMRSAGP